VINVGTTVASIDDIKRLREETGAGIMEAKRALNEAGGDFGKAKKLLEQWGAASAAKRAGRTASQGVIEPYIHGGGQIGALVELDCETDFVARTEDFRNLAHEIAMHVAAMNPRYLSIDEIPEAEAGEVRQRLRDEAISKGKTAEIADRVAEGGFRKYLEQNVLLEQPYVRDDSKKIKQLVQEVATKTGENVLVKRFTRYQIGL
jgi:elongation factor Ts